MEAAIAEFDLLRRDAFLAKYQFGRARTYFIEYKGESYDSKAIVGAAHGYLPGRDPLRASDFSGGELSVANHLRSLGFHVPGPDSPVHARLADVVDDGYLVEQIARLRPAGTRDRPVRHQALMLLWAIGRAELGLPRLTRWADVRDELQDLLARFGLPENRPTPEYAFVALAHTDWWELPSATSVPRAHSGAVLRWLNAVNPEGGMPSQIYGHLAANREARDAVVGAILVRFFRDETATDLLAAVGLTDHAISSRTRADTAAAGKPRSPRWTWTELVLACDLTARNSWHELDVNNPAVVEMSELLRRLPMHAESARPSDFRSPGSVRLKMTNLAHCHPNSGRKPSNRGPLDAEVVQAFLERPEAMHTLAEQIRQQTLDAQGPYRIADPANASESASRPGSAGVKEPLAQFKPKSDEAYAAAIKAQVQMRSRLHEGLVADYGRAARRCGFTPATNVHPRDLTLTRSGRHWLVEVKIIYAGNATDAVRAVVGQLLQYRHFLYKPDETVELVAVFNEAVGDAYTDFLETLGIRSVWRHNDAWEGSVTARGEGLFPRG